MEKNRWLIAAAVACLTALDVHAEDRLYIEDFEIKQGETRTVEVLMENPDAEYRNLQFDLYLPDGVSVARDEEGDLLYDTGDRCTDDHTLVVSERDGYYRGMLYSTNSIPLSGHEGTVLTLTLKAGNNVGTGALKGYFRNVKLAKGNGTGPTYAEFSFTITATATPLTWLMEEGWNWVSHNRANPIDPREVFGENVVEVKSQTKGLIRDPEHGWVGNLTELVATEAYKVRAQSADTKPTALVGSLFAPTTAIEVEKGWNWMGCPLLVETDIATALRGFMPEEGDRIVGESLEAEYKGGTWVGTLKVLSPGEGYMYQAGRKKTVLFGE